MLVLVIAVSFATLFNALGEDLLGSVPNTVHFLLIGASKKYDFPFLLGRCRSVALTHVTQPSRYKDSCWAPNVFTLLALLVLFSLLSYPLAVWGITVFYVTAARKKGDDLLAKYIFTSESGI